MKRVIRSHGGRGAWWAALAVGACLPIASARAADRPGAAAPGTAAEMVRASGAPGGVCVTAGTSSAELALSLAKQGSFIVHCLAREPGLCDSMRKEIRGRGVYGTVSAGTFDGRTLPYTENLVNLLVVDSYPGLAQAGLSRDEVLRVLAPLGTAFLGTSSASAASGTWADELAAGLRSAGIGDVAVVRAGGTWVRLRKPWPADIDEWTHYLHGADGNPVAQDRVVGPPQHYQWLSDPLWQRCHEADSSISTLVTSQGRLFYIEDQAPIGLAGQHALPDKWFLVARDAFNGMLLWKVPIRRWGWREWKNTWWDARPGDIPLNVQKRLVAAGDKLYVTLGYQAPVSQLDARSGEILQTYADTEGAAEILYLDGRLILSARDGKQIRVMALEAASGKRLWTTDKSYRGTTVDYVKFGGKNGGVEPLELDPSLNMAADQGTVALIDGPQVVGLDARTGREKWRADFPQDEADRSAGGVQTQGDLWIGTMIVRGGVVIHASPNKLAALAADTGKVLWEQPKKYIGHLWYEWKDVFVIGDLVWTWSAEMDDASLGGPGKKQHALWPRSANGYDLHTGEVKKQVPVGSIFNANHHHRCYRDKATVNYILASRRGTEYVDLEHGQHTVDNWVRGTCHVGMMPANGLQYVPPHPCQCYIDEKLSGLYTLAPQRPADRQPQPPRPSQLDRGIDLGQIEGPEAGPEDWPAFRHDALRSGAVSTQLPADAAALWRVKLGSKVSPPTVVGGRLFTALVDEHHVACLDVRDGRTLWQFAAGGRIDSQPTYARGAVLFGSADGCVYCLRASDGKLAWRFHAAPEDRLIGAFGQLESAWPVHGSVLVQNGTVYFAAGRSSQLDGGITMYGLDAATGQVRCQATLDGPHYYGDNIEQNFQLPMGTLSDILLAEGDALYMRGHAYGPDLKPTKGTPSLQVPGGFLDETYFKRIPWTFGKKTDYGRLLVHDEQNVYFVRMFDTLRGLDPTVFFTPGAKGYRLFAKGVSNAREAWSMRVPVRVRAMVLAAGRLVIAGPPDVLDAEDPLGAFEGRKGGVLCVFDAASGEKSAEQLLPSPPRFNGMAAASGRLYVAEEDGSITCFGK